MNGTTQGKEVFIPLDWVIGGKGGIGNGWKMLVSCLSAGRGISLPALSAGSDKEYMGKGLEQDPVIWIKVAE